LLAHKGHADADVCWHTKTCIFVCLCLSNFLSPMHEGKAEGVRNIAVIESGSRIAGMQGVKRIRRVGIMR